jgi:capsular exopolysaccharide synthesis family protein
MSRIQDILARAERDGTARRTQSSPVEPDDRRRPATVPEAFVAPPIDGTAALDAAPFRAELAAVATPPAAVAAAASATIEMRTAQATLHPALVAAIAPHSPVAEQYRAVRSRITHENGAPVRTIMVTSPGVREGKSVTAANLALAMAQEFQRQAVLVDADLRGSSVHALFGLDRGPGLADVLAGEATLDEALVHLPDFRLTLLPAGTTPHYPTELLGSTAMRRVVDTLRARFDRVLLDLPPVMPLADVGTVAPLADGVVMVVRASVTQRPALDQALAALGDHRVLGVVLNEVR